MSYHHLTMSERKIIAQMLKEGESKRSIARKICRSPSTVCREIERNKTRMETGDGRIQYPYRHRNAHKRYLTRIHACRSGKYLNERLSAYVQEKLLCTWSPEQVAGRIQLDYQHDPTMRVSHSTIYRWLHKNQLEQASAIRLRHAGKLHGDGRGKFPGIKLLNKRCKEAYRRKRYGDWELDTIISSSRQDQSGILNMCDRKTRYCVLVILRQVKSAKQMFMALAAISGTIPCLTFTADQGTEFGCYKRVENELGIPMYFCKPRSPWQKGSVENANGLIREFFPKGTNFEQVTQADVDRVMSILNNRPKKCLHWKTPAEAFHPALNDCCT